MPQVRAFNICLSEEKKPWIFPEFPLIYKMREASKWTALGPAILYKPLLLLVFKHTIVSSLVHECVCSNALLGTYTRTINCSTEEEHKLPYTEYMQSYVYLKPSRNIQGKVLSGLCGHSNLNERVCMYCICLNAPDLVCDKFQWYWY